MALEVISGPMFSGKTEELLRRIRREQIAKRKVLLFKPNIDKRYSEDSVSSHNKSMLKATVIDSAAEIERQFRLHQPEVIGIDEIQFFDDSVLDFCLKNKKTVKIIVSCLNLDFRGEPFKFFNSNKHIGELIVHANEAKMLSAICTHNGNGKICGKEAFFTQRLINGKPAPYFSPLILVGSTEAYEARCSEHHSVPEKESLKF